MLLASNITMPVLLNEERPGHPGPGLLPSLATPYFFTGAVVGFGLAGRAVATLAGTAGVTATGFTVLALAGVVSVVFLVMVACLCATLALVAWCMFAFVTAGLAVAAGCCVVVAGCCALTTVAVNRLAPSTVAIKRVFIGVAGFLVPEKTGTVSRHKCSDARNRCVSYRYQFNRIGKRFRRSLRAVYNSGLPQWM